MAFITLTGDSDGDLHTADLHNKKFGAIASVLNGNIEHNNLKFPYSVGYFNWVTNANAFNWYGIGTNSTQGTIGGLTGISTAANANALKMTWVRVPKAMTLLSLKLIAAAHNAFASGDNFTIELQKSSSLSGTYTVIGTKTEDFYNASATGVIEEYTVPISSPSISANDYIRLVLKNPPTHTGGDWTDFSAILEYKTYTVA